jgi:hypothetical protein
MRSRNQWQLAPRHGRTLIVIIAVTIVAAIAAFLVWQFAGDSAPQTNVARETADLFLERIRSGDFKSAWESTTTDFKSDEGLASFTAHAKKQVPSKEPLEFVEMKEIQVFGLTRWECVYRAPKQPDKTIRILIGNEQDAWRVEQIKVE